MSVVFDFNASLNDVAPVSPMSLSVEFNENEKLWFVDRFYSCIVSFAPTIQIKFR